jgi:chromosome partitioning protein
MPIIAVISQKGGPGKSTVSMNLAIACHLSGESVAVLDTDPQCSISQWGDIRVNEGKPDPVVVAIPPSRLKQAIATTQEDKTQWVIIDTAPFNSEGILTAARMADLCIVPCRPSILDLSAISTTLDLCSAADAKVGLLLNAIRSKPQLQEARSALKDLASGSAKREMCSVDLWDRTDYSKAVVDGLGVLEFSPSGKAAQEIKQLHKWVCKNV